MSVSSRDIIRKLEAAGWELVRVKGSHHQFRKDGRLVTVPHPRKEFPKGLLKAIERQTGISLH
jgi:predicted RNA binding protein YcfA (HicA-like mRNA interferase family)